jgi:hypothetical protein
MHVFAAPVLLLILSGFMGIKRIYATAVNSPYILTVMALIALTGILKKHCPFTESLTSLGTQADHSGSRDNSGEKIVKD